MPKPTMQFAAVDTHTQAVARVLGSPEQQQLWDMMRDHNQPAIRVEAVAGSGKTFSLDMGARVSGYRPGDITYLAFNKENQVEAQGKAGGSVRDGGAYHAKTYHGLGREALVATYPELRRMQVEPKRMRALIAQLAESGAVPELAQYGKDKERGWAFRYGVEKLCGHAKQVGASTREQMEALVDLHGVEFADPKQHNYSGGGGGDRAGLEAAGVDAAIGVLLVAMEPRGKHGWLATGIDFDDMIWLPYALNLQHNVPKSKLLLGDESQDLNEVQHWLLSNAGERVVFTGDSHQAIYGWRGAHQNSMDLLAQRLGKQFGGGPVVEVGLTYTRRCPKRVAAVAQLLVPYIKAMPDAPDGVVREQRGLVVDGVGPEPGDMVLARTNAPLVEHAFALWKRGVPAVIRGRATQAEVMRLLESNEQGGIGATVLAAERQVGDEVGRLLALPDGKGEARASRLMDTLEILQQVAKAVAPSQLVADMKAALVRLFGEGRPSGEVVVLSTVHRAKGLEAPRVWVVGTEQFPHKSAKRDWELEGERNVLYVAETRAKGELVWVGPGGAPGWARPTEK